MPRVPERTVYFYGTCLIDLFYPRIGLAAIEVLQRENVSVIFPPEQSCCGQPAWNSGYREQAQNVIHAQLNLFNKPHPIIVPSASCAGMIKNHWPQAFDPLSRQSQQAQGIADRVIEFTDFLVNHLHMQPELLENPMKIAVHNSCSSIREMNVAGNIEHLLNKMGVELTQQANKQECCGFGGTFAVKQADISGAMVQDKTQALLESNADMVISQDCGCLMNIGGALEHQKKTLPVYHIAEFLRKYCYE